MKTIIFFVLVMLLGVVTVVAENNETTTTVSSTTTTTLGGNVTYVLQQLHISRTDYQIGDNAMIFAQYLRSDGKPYTPTTGCCEFRMFYPNRTLYYEAHTWTVGVYSEPSVWSYSFIAPSVVGVYPVIGKCWIKQTGQNCQTEEPADSVCGGDKGDYLGTCIWGQTELNIRNYGFNNMNMSLGYLLNETHLIKNYTIENYQDNQVVKNITTETYEQTTTIFSRVEAMWNGTTSWILRLLGLAEDTNTTLHEFQNETNEKLTLPSIHFITN